MKKQDYEKTRDRVRTLRRKLGMNADAFGELLGVCGRTVENWEQGRNSLRGPALKLLTQIEQDSMLKK